jgi:hypothetical protein
MSRELMKAHVAFGGLDRCLTKVNAHQDIFHVVYDFKIPSFLPREFLSRVIWKWTGDDELTTVADTRDVHHDAFQECNNYLRASSTATMKFTREATRQGVAQTRVSLIQNVDLGGAVPGWVQNRQGVGQLV